MVERLLAALTKARHDELVDLGMSRHNKDPDLYARLGVTRPYVGGSRTYQALQEAMSGGVGYADIQAALGLAPEAAAETLANLI